MLEPNSLYDIKQYTAESTITLPEFTEGVEINTRSEVNSKTFKSPTEGSTIIVVIDLLSQDESRLILLISIIAQVIRGKSSLSKQN